MKSIVAIEVSRDAIRAAEIGAPFSKNPKVLKIGEIEIPVDVAGESEVHDEEVFVEFVNQLWEEEKFSTRNVVLVVSGRRFLVREHSTAHRSMKDLRKVLSIEAATVLPDHMTDPIIDFYPTHHIEDSQGKVERTAGLVIATPSEPIEKIVHALATAKMNVEIVDFAPMAIARFIRNNIDAADYGEGYALVNIREFSTDILVTKGNTPRLIRVPATGLPPQKRRSGRHAAQVDVSLTDNARVEKSPLEALARQIRMTVSAQVDDLGITINKLYLTGPRSDEETVEKLTELLDMEVVPLSAVSASHKEGINEELSSSDFVAVCAGTRGGKK